MATKEDIDLMGMQAALAQAALALAEGNLPIGAAIVHEGKVIATGRNGVESGRNDTQHAEMVALQSAAEFLFTHKRECTLYTTLEPCMMCLGALINTGIGRVVYATNDPLVGASPLLSTLPYYAGKKIQLSHGLLRQQAQAMLNDYVIKTGYRGHLQQTID